MKKYSAEQDSLESQVSEIQEKLEQTKASSAHIGQFDFPLSEKEIAEARRKAEQEAVEKAKRKKNRQRESNAAHRAKTKVERWAANDGHKYPKRICEQCGKEFYQNSTRQRFCNTDCTKAHQQVEALFSRLVKQLSEKEGVTEALKVEN